MPWCYAEKQQDGSADASGFCREEAGGLGRCLKVTREGEGSLENELGLCRQAKAGSADT